jgi:N-acetylneuraminic acid mutarotase
MKTTTSLIICLVLFTGFISPRVEAQWSAAGKMGSGPTDGCFNFVINGKAYVGGGSNSDKFYQYDTAAHVWTQKGTTPGGGIRGWSFSFALNGKGYLIGGDSTGNFNECATVWAYNPDSNSWTQKNNFPGGPRDAGFSFAINDTGYVGCGFDGMNVYNDMWKYNATNDSWTQLDTVPFGFLLFPSSFVINNKAYVCVGEVNTPTNAYEVSANWEYNPATGAWTQKANFPGTARQTAFSFALNGMGYVGGGQSGYATVYNDMWRYNPTTNVWTSAGTIPSQYPAWSTSFAIGNTGYMGTGVYFGATSLFGTDSFYKYKPVATDVQALNTTGTIKIYPNPATDRIDISGLKGDETITIHDLTGRLVKTFKGVNNHINIGDLNSGIYNISVQSNTGINNIRVIKE